MSKNEEQAEEYNVFVNADGSTTEWRQAGLLHRSGDLPALEREDGAVKEYWENGERHRADGKPAFIDECEDLNEYWLNGREYFPEELNVSDEGHLFVIYREDSFAPDSCLGNVVKIIGYVFKEKEAKSLVAHCMDKTRHGVNDARDLPGQPSDVEFSYERVKPFSDRQFDKNELDIELSFA